MSKNYFKSYIWLLETLQSRGPQTLSQLRELWDRSAVNGDGRDLAPRTFANHVAAIADIFGKKVADLKKVKVLELLPDFCRIPGYLCVIKIFEI